MDEMVLTELGEQERDEALGRYKIIQPFLEGQMTLKAAAQAHGISYRTAGRWVSRYRRSGLIGLAKTHLQNVATAAAINLTRMVAWLNEIPKGQTHQSRFAALATSF